MGTPAKNIVDNHPGAGVPSSLRGFLSYKWWIMGPYKKKRMDKSRSRTSDFKKMCVDYKGGECQNCGIEYHTWQYDFHHINPSFKEKGISQMVGSSLEKVKPELDKCMLLCKNCHADIHWNPKFKKVIRYEGRYYSLDGLEIDWNEVLSDPDLL